MTFVKSTLQRIAVKRLAAGSLPLALFLFLGYLSVHGALRAAERRRPTAIQPSAIESLSPDAAERYIEVPILGRHAPEIDVLGVETGSFSSGDSFKHRYCHLVLREAKDRGDDDPLVVLAKLPCGPRTATSKCSFAPPNGTDGVPVARGWLSRVKGSTVLRDLGDILQTMEETKEEKKLRKKVEKIRVPLVLDAVRSPPTLGPVFGWSAMALLFAVAFAVLMWLVFPRNYRSSALYTRLARPGRTAAEVEAEIDTDMRQADPSPIPYPDGSVLSMSYLVMVKHLSWKVHFIGDIESYKNVISNGRFAVQTYNKKGEHMFTLYFPDAMSGLEVIHELLARRDMLRESAHWRESARARARARSKAEGGAAPEDPAELLRKREAAASENYKVLGLSPSATKEDVRKAWRKIALASHPDKQPTPELKAHHEPIFRRATQAKEELEAMLEAREAPAAQTQGAKKDK